MAGWPFKKTKHDGEASSSRGNKKPRRRRYVRLDFARRLWEENRPVPWPDANLPSGGWYLNSRRVPVPPVPSEGRERRREVLRRRSILPPDLREDPAFAVNSYNWVSFGTREFDPRRRAGYLGDEAFFNAHNVEEEEEDEQDHDMSSDDDEEEEEEQDHDTGSDEEEEEEEDHDAGSDDYAAFTTESGEEGEDGGYHGDAPYADGGAPWNPEHQPLDIDPDVAVQMAMAQSKLDELARWDGLVIQLRDSALQQGRPATPPATPPQEEWEPWPQDANAPPPPSAAWDPWPPSPQAAVPPPPPPMYLMAPPPFIDLTLLSSDEE